jgi:hypothetical protein
LASLAAAAADAPRLEVLSLLGLLIPKYLLYYYKNAGAGARGERDMAAQKKLIETCFTCTKLALLALLVQNAGAEAREEREMAALLHAVAQVPLLY